MLRLFTKNAGFSLLELMVVVAMIGILSAVGIPQYERFQNKARATEARSTLTAIYVGEVSYFSEWNQYNADLTQIGVRLVGSDLRYTAGWGITGMCGTIPPAPVEALYALKSQTHLTAVTPAADATWRQIIVTNGTTIHALGGTCNVRSAFTAVAIGDPRQVPMAISPLTSDQWQINQQKAISNTVVGL